MRAVALIAATLLLAAPAVAQEADDPELIFKNTTVWRVLSPDAKLATYAIDDPGVEEDPDGQLVELLPMAYRRHLDEQGFH